MSLEINKGVRNARIIVAAREFDALRNAHEKAVLTLINELVAGGMRREDAILASDEESLRALNIRWRRE